MLQMYMQIMRVAKVYICNKYSMIIEYILLFKNSNNSPYNLQTLFAT